MKTQGESGYITVDRKLLQWEWWQDANTAHLWLYLLLRANYKPARFKGMKVGRGQVLESVRTIAKNTGLSVQNVRTCLNRLKSTQEITLKVTQHGTLITIVKYSVYQRSAVED